MKAETFIPYKFPGLNDYVRECRGDKYRAARMKHETEEVCWFFVKNLPHFSKPVHIDFVWHEQNKRRDLDNIAFAKKFVLDALVKFEVLDGDSQRHVTGFSDSFVIGEEYGVKITIQEDL